MRQNGNSNINLHLTVKNAGYLKEAYIDFRDEQNGRDTNYEISTDSSDTTLIQSVNKTLKTVSLNYIDYGTDAIIQMPINLPLENLLDINKLKQNTLVTLRGIYVDKNGKEINIVKTIKLNLGWTIETELELEQSVVKYVPYVNGEEKGLILQVAVKTKQNRDDFVLPVNKSQIKLNVPEIEGTLPEKIQVVADKTLATNGDRIEFTENNWEYNNQDNTIIINTQGYKENEKVLAGIGEDIYLVTYTYPSEVYDIALEDEILLQHKVEAKMELYSAEGIIEKTAMSDESIMLNQKIGDIVTYNIEAKEQEISKGRMYANCNSNIRMYDTEYKTTMKANISNSEMIENITMKLSTDDFVFGENIYPINNTYYKELVINKARMQKIFGEDSFVNIFDGANTYTINKDTQDVNGNYVITFEDGISNLIVQTSKPIEDGIFKIDATKIVSKDLTYSKEQLKQFNELKVNVIDMNNETTYDLISLTETNTNAKFEISNTNLIALTENKNVEFKITLNNNVETSDLYKNPIFTINLPKYIEEIDILGGNILYTSGLEIDHVEKVYTENGIVLTLITKGAESAFSDGVLTNGSVILLNTNIKVGEVEADLSDKVVFTYTNENAVSYANEGKEEIDVNFIAREIVASLDTTQELQTPVDSSANVSLEASTKAIYHDEELTNASKVFENEKVIYRTTIKNNGTIDAQNVQLVTNITNGRIIGAVGKVVDADGKVLTTKEHTVSGENVTTFTFTWERIPVGCSGIFEYTVLPKEIKQIENDENIGSKDGKYAKFDEDDNSTEITYEEYVEYIKLKNAVEITADGLAEKIENRTENIIDTLKLRVELSADTEFTYINGAKIFINMFVKNVSKNEMNNVVITYTLPEGMEYVPINGETQIKYNESNRTLTIDIGKFEPDAYFRENINVKINLPEKVGEREFTNKLKVNANGTETYCSDTLKINAVAPVLSVDLSSNTTNGAYVKEGKNIEITGIAKNAGGANSTDTVISIELPDGFTVSEAKYTLDSGETKELTSIYGNEYYLHTPLAIGEKITFKIIGSAKIQSDSDEEEININATIEDGKRSKISSNVLTYKIEKVIVDPDNPDAPDIPTVKTYKITGTAWLDENKDGKKDSNEKLLEGINVLLIDAKTGVIVTDRTNGTVKETKTSGKGEYTFSNLLEGTYMVIFEYDSAYYDITDYNKTGITEDLSSKAIQTKINKDGISKIAGVTNTIIISNSSISNLNIGLVERPKFDLSLEKQISKVTIDNKAGTKTYTFENNKLGKIDIPAGNLNSTTATIEYKIIIKNNGAVPGSAKKIVDYIPNDVYFDEVINAGWYKGEDGNLYNNTLTNTIINPGESKELTLIVTKKMTEDNTGTILNRAEIYEDYNEFGYSDYNSTPGNKAQNENDLDNAELIITVKTGEIILYITITIISIAIIAIGAFVINKKVLKGGNN